MIPEVPLATAPYVAKKKIGLLQLLENSIKQDIDLLLLPLSEMIVLYG